MRHKLQLNVIIFSARKEILHKVSGNFPSGNLIAIMGEYFIRSLTV